MIKTEQALEIQGTRQVRLGSRLIAMQDAPIGREFSVDGYTYQLIVSPSTFGMVPALGRFRKDGVWYRRAKGEAAQQLDPNSPLSDVSKLGIAFHATDRVDALEIIFRGRDEKAA